MITLHVLTCHNKLILTNNAILTNISPYTPPDCLEESHLPRDSNDVTAGRLRVNHFTANLTRTRENPLRGFIHRLGHSTPNDFPCSLEYANLPFADLMDGPSSFTFDTGLEPSLQLAEARSHQLVLRVYIDYPSKTSSGLPDFLKGKVLVHNYTEHGGGQSPDYNNPDLQQALLALIKALGKTYDGDRRLAVVQAGLLGFWGEWHTFPHPDWFPGEQFQRDVLNQRQRIQDDHASSEAPFRQQRRPEFRFPRRLVRLEDDR